MEQKKYMDIERLKDKYVDGFQKGDYIVVQEKIDVLISQSDTMKKQILSSHSARRRYLI